MKLKEYYFLLKWIFRQYWRSTISTVVVILSLLWFIFYDHTFLKSSTFGSYVYPFYLTYFVPYVSYFFSSILPSFRLFRLSKRALRVILLTHFYTVLEILKPLSSCEEKSLEELYNQFSKIKTTEEFSNFVGNKMITGDGIRTVFDFNKKLQSSVNEILMLLNYIPVKLAEILYRIREVSIFPWTKAFIGSDFDHAYGRKNIKESLKDGASSLISIHQEICILATYYKNFFDGSLEYTTYQNIQKFSIRN